MVPDSESEFGYIGKHYILAVPDDVYPDDEGEAKLIPKFFELQIKTLFQHAWSEANHDIAYKPVTTLTSLQKRQLAFTAAQAWGADQIFETLSRELLPQPEV
jgi:ppGpp synthetase/RelA/SpoT-type nucleotidyltranferase